MKNLCNIVNVFIILLITSVLISCGPVPEINGLVLKKDDDVALNINPVFTSKKTVDTTKLCIKVDSTSYKEWPLSSDDSSFIYGDKFQNTLYNMTFPENDSKDSISMYVGNLLVLKNGGKRYFYSIDVKSSKKIRPLKIPYAWICVIPVILFIILRIIIFFQKIKKGHDWKGKKIVIGITILVGFLIPVSILVGLYLDEDYVWIGNNTSPFVDTPVWFLIGLVGLGGVLGYYFNSILGYYYEQKYVP